LDPQKFFTEMSLLEAVMGRREDVNHLKFLFDAFMPNYYWTEVMECLRKLLLTGFVVFFYEGSGLQILFGLSISIVFAVLYAKLDPYLMPSNNTFVVFVHFNISFTLLLTLLVRVNETFTQDQSKQFQVNELSISYALLISNASVLLVGVIYILRDTMFKNEADYRIFESKSSNE